MYRFRKELGVLFRIVRKARGYGSIEKYFEQVDSGCISQLTLVKIEQGDESVKTCTIDSIADSFNIKIPEYTGLPEEVQQFYNWTKRVTKEKNIDIDKELRYLSWRLEEARKTNQIKAIAEIMVYLPLIDPKILYDVCYRISMRIDDADYVKKEINYALSTIENSIAKEYAEAVINKEDVTYEGLKAYYAMSERVYEYQP